MPAYDHLLPLTPDLNAERLETLKKLLPDLFTNEGRLNLDELRKLADPDGLPETERYEFRWFGKNLAKRTAFTPSNATLVRDPTFGKVLNFAKGSDGDTAAPDSFIIEGENLEVLKLLLAAYRERVKCIYIDPPYNTGKDFVYSDNYTEDRRPYWENTGVTQDGVKIDTNTDADGRYHSNWLNMMYSRLLLARQLLRPDGVIFISIDDNEVTNLRKLCDEVFGEENFVANIVWQKKYAATNDSQGFSTTHDYIVAFQKSENFQRNLLPRTEEQNKPYKYDDKDGRGLWRSGDLLVKSFSATAVYAIVNPNTEEEFYPPKGSSWRANQETMKKWLEEKRIYFGKDGKGAPQLKRYLSEVQQGIVPVTWWPYEDAGHNDGANRELSELFESKTPFDTPKPVKLIKKIFQLSTSPDQNDLILDFFAGSGTTGQAVMELNAEDGGNRRFILVQIPEATDPASEAHKAGYKKISDITIERCRRVAEKIAAGGATSAKKAKTATPEAAPLFAANGSEPDEPLAKFETLPKVTPPTVDPPNVGFQVLRLQKSYFPRTEWTPDPAKPDAENEKDLRDYIRLKESQLVTLFNREELISEILLKQGFLLNYSVVKLDTFAKNDLFRCTDGEKEAWVCLDNQLFNETLQALFAAPPPKFICLERTLDTTQKWNLKHTLGDRFHAF